MVLTLANNILRVDNYPESEEAFYYRGRVYELRGDARLARREYNKALDYNPFFKPAQEALERLDGE
jgi:tetratricopeptide (TPR) repeat protein